GTAGSGRPVPAGALHGTCALPRVGSRLGHSVARAHRAGRSGARRADDLSRDSAALRRRRRSESTQGPLAPRAHAAHAERASGRARSAGSAVMRAFALLVALALTQAAAAATSLQATKPLVDRLSRSGRAETRIGQTISSDG